MLPIGDTIPGRNPPIAVWLLILGMSLVFRATPVSAQPAMEAAAQSLEAPLAGSAAGKRKKKAPAWGRGLLPTHAQGGRVVRLQGRTVYGWHHNLFVSPVTIAQA